MSDAFGAFVERVRAWKYVPAIERTTSEPDECLICGCIVGHTGSCGDTARSYAVYLARQIKECS